MIPGPDKALQVAKQRTASQVVGATQLVPVSPAILAVLAFGLMFIALRYPMPGILVAGPAAAVLLVAAVRAEYSSLLARNADGSFELILQNPITRKVSVQALDSAAISVPESPTLGFRTIVVEGRSYRVRPNFDPELRLVRSQLPEHR